MQTVFEAANSLEAHMILGLLAQAGIEGQVLGEFLQGGIGDLPAAGLVSVVVSDTDFVPARIIVEDWNAKPAHNPTQPSSNPRKSVSLGQAVLFVAIGLALGIASTRSYFLASLNSQGVDYNNDGQLDDFWYYSGNRIQRIESDLNKDGKIDVVIDYDLSGHPQKSRDDIDFDGKFDTLSIFEQGVIVKTDYDKDHDGRNEAVEIFQNGNLKLRDFFVSPSTLVKKRQRFKNGSLTESELDTDNDGIFDRLIRYDEIGEIISTKPLRKNQHQ